VNKQLSLVFQPMLTFVTLLASMKLL